MSHDTCTSVIVDTAASRPGTGGEIEAFEQPEPPASRGTYHPEAFVCPHGAVIWVLPSHRQISAWERLS